ncbi:MAG: hypothetical protein N2Z57_07845, partial [Oscillospiraceae bacterium]|nr:hypothetical protein [Oscillospiraceae bacterium]
MEWVYAAAGSLLKIAEHIARVKLLPLLGGGSFLFYSCPVRHIISQEDFKDGRDKKVEEKNFDKLIPYFSDKIRSALEKVSIKDKIQEIRLRSEKPLSVTSFGKELFITENGGISSSPLIGLAVGKKDVEYSFKAVCEYSVHSFQKELSQGYITLPGGHRVGLCGSAVIKDGKIETIKHISGMNFRIANEVKGCADEIMKILFASKIEGTLIIGPPLSGKTTVLRDLCRQLGNLRKGSLIDERRQIASASLGLPQNDVGICT